jgi:hypothetical protein
MVHLKSLDPKVEATCGEDVGGQIMVMSLPLLPVLDHAVSHEESYA